jgi:hypothetical protein
MKRPGRINLMRKVCRLANLPSTSCRTCGYFTRTQLKELALYLESVNEKLNGNHKKDEENGDTSTNQPRS